jgi:hypothetical protein
MAFESTPAPGTIRLAAESAPGPWCLGFDHPSVAAELALSFADNPGPGIVRHSFPILATLNAVLPCVYPLAVAPPIRTAQNFPQTNHQASTDQETLIEVLPNEYD